MGQFIFAKDIRAGMFIIEGKKPKRVTDIPQSCDIYRKIHIRTEKGNTGCYDRMAEVEIK